MNIIYKDPKIKLLKCNDKDLGFDLWCRSRGDFIKGDWNEDEELVVGTENLSTRSYRNRIDEMNLQYNNFPSFVFEIEGSCLFRDILYTLNKTSQWSLSLRFLNATIKDRLDPELYPICSEYTGIPEWEEAFYEYYEDIKKYKTPDENRKRMPYSRMTKFWVGINYKTLSDFLSFLHNYSPFFYRVYGKVMRELLESEGVIINEKIFKRYESPIIDQYIRDNYEFKEQVTKIHDFYHINININLLLYSQFIRQSSATIQGLYNLIMHTDPNEFSHKVFKGDTLIQTTYMAHRSRVQSTLSNRSCWFSMSDGMPDDPGSWSKILELYLANCTLQEFKKLLPCHGMKDYCKYRDDVKFRNEGVESGSLPCAFLTENIEYAYQRYDKCNNKLNEFYIKLMEDDKSSK